jgi:hypothetical protein
MFEPTEPDPLLVLRTLWEEYIWWAERNYNFVAPLIQDKYFNKLEQFYKEGKCDALIASFRAEMAAKERGSS